MSEAGGGLGREVAAFVIGLVAVFVPAGCAGLAPELVPMTTLLGVAVGGGALAGYLFVPGGERRRAHLVAIACGMLAALGAFAVTAGWVAARGAFSSIEMMLAAAAGGAPGILLGQWLYPRVRRPDERVPRARARERRGPG